MKPYHFILLTALTSQLMAAEFMISVPVGAAKLPTGWNAYQGSDATLLVSPKRHPHVELMPIADGTGGDGALETQIPELVKKYVLEWHAGKQSSITIAGQPATRYVATGVEADDLDPTSAQATVFTIDGHRFLLLAHGEGFDAEAVNPEIEEILASIHHS